MQNQIGRLSLIIVYFVMLNVYDIHNQLIKDKDLKHLLSPLEWNTLIGEDDENYAITFPIHTRSKSKRNNKLEIQAPNFGQNFLLDLQPTPKLTSSDFIVLESYANQTVPFSINNNTTDDLDCYFHGPNTALSLCDGVRGIVHSNNDYLYVIHPLPKRFHNLTLIPHILLKRQHFNSANGFDQNRLNKCLQSKEFNRNLTTIILQNNMKQLKNNCHEIIVEKYDKPDNNFKRSKREIFSVSATVFIETAVFVDKDLFDQMKTNFPIDTEREIIRFVLAMINAVQLLYHDPSLGRPVNFVLKRLEILKDEVAGLVRPPDIDRYLSNFCNWQRTKNPAGDREPLHWDHALILTGLDLYVRGKHGKISNQVVGLAPVAGMCTASSSCTVNEGRHFESVYVVAHEIGHNLGMRHDGPLADNDCDPSGYIMSPTLGGGKITWSPCSKRYLQKFLETPQSRCLLDHGSSAGQLDHGAEGVLPGERFNSDQQCMLKYGKGSRHSSQQPIDDICRDLHCERERYTWTSHPALEGTYCGTGMWCRGGRCVSKSSHYNGGSYNKQLKQASHLERINGGWSKWIHSECASGCLFGDEGRLRSGSTGIMIMERMCNNPRPEGEGLKCEGPQRKYQTCHAKQCHNVPRLTIKEFIEQICTRAKEVDTDLTGSGMQKIVSDPEEACVVWCQKRNGGTKSRGWKLPDGTTCQTRRNKYVRASYCINGRCEEFVCDPYEEAIFTQMPDLCPVERESNDIMWRTGLRRREGIVKWKSASGCHYNCISPGSGIRLVMNKKLAKSSIQLCQPDLFGCGKVKSPFQHASLICNKYKDRVRRLSGLGMQISPSLEDPDRPCRVACQDENISHRFYLVNGEDGWFPFGTDCSKGSNNEKKAFCISGKCLTFGTDDTPLSESEFTLPLLSRNKRSLESISKKVTVKLNQKELDAIVEKFNKTLSGIVDHSTKMFDIDLDNPVHIHKDSDTIAYNYFGNDYNYSTHEDTLNYT